jgi:hypothetical protein
VEPVAPMPAGPAPSAVVSAPAPKPAKHAAIPAEPPPAPPVVATPEPPAIGAVAFQGADAVRLRAADGTIAPASAAPAGRYTALATFGGDEVSAGYVTIEAGKTAHLVCVAAMKRCSPR